LWWLIYLWGVVICGLEPLGCQNLKWPQLELSLIKSWEKYGWKHSYLSELLSLRGENEFKPCQQIEILVPFRSYLKNFHWAPLSLLNGIIPFLGGPSTIQHLGEGHLIYCSREARLLFKRSFVIYPWCSYIIVRLQLRVIWVQTSMVYRYEGNLHSLFLKSGCFVSGMQKLGHLEHKFL